MSERLKTALILLSLILGTALVGTAILSSVFYFLFSHIF